MVLSQFQKFNGFIYDIQSPRRSRMMDHDQARVHFSYWASVHTYAVKAVAQSLSISCGNMRRDRPHRILHVVSSILLMFLDEK